MFRDHRHAIGPINIGNHLLSYNLTSFAVRLFTVVNGGVVFLCKKVMIDYGLRLGLGLGLMLPSLFALAFDSGLADR